MRIEMPAKSPPVGDILAAQLVTLGARIRAQRERHKLTATSVAEAAGMSRVTLHRIERGEPSVTMGAYLSAISAVGLQFELNDPEVQSAKLTGSLVPGSVRLDDYPQLKRLAWQLRGATEVTPTEALNLYERNWRHVDQGNMAPAERALVQALVDTLGGGRLLV
jgi:transcriptional regulator with XRE-family HTH domain